MKFNGIVPSQRLGKHCLCAEAIMKMEQGNVMCSGSVGTVATHGVTMSSPCASDCVRARVYNPKAEANVSGCATLLSLKVSSTPSLLGFI